MRAQQRPRSRQMLIVGSVASVALSAILITGSLHAWGDYRLRQRILVHTQTLLSAYSFAVEHAMAEHDHTTAAAVLDGIEGGPTLALIGAYVVASDGSTILTHSETELHDLQPPFPDEWNDNRTRSSDAIRLRPGGYVDAISRLDEVGTLLLRFSMEPGLAHQRQNTLFAAVTSLLALGALAGLVWSYYGVLSRRLEWLRVEVLRRGQDESTQQLPIEGPSEFAELASTFNDVLSRLGSLRAKQAAATQQLEALQQQLSVKGAAIEELKEQLAADGTVPHRLQLDEHSPSNMVGASPALQALLVRARQLGPFRMTVLITGESGTGKELIANYLHAVGPRSGGPFVKVNCAAIPVTLLENELFGHERGAFTGAVTQKKGKFEIANGGTLFLDEIGELSLEAQAKLLRVLQEGELYRLGSVRPIPIDTRVIVATNRRLEDDVLAGRFREDLYYRLRVAELRVPPLRDRTADIPALAQHFLRRYADELDKPVVGLSRNALALLQAYTWPGNVRELENAIASAVALATRRVLGAEDIGSLLLGIGRGSGAAGGAIPVLGECANGPAARLELLLTACGMSAQDLRAIGLEGLVDVCERICLQAALEAHGSQAAAATSLGLKTTKMHRLIRKYGLTHVRKPRRSEPMTTPHHATSESDAREIG